MNRTLEIFSKIIEKNIALSTGISGGKMWKHDSEGNRTKTSKLKRNKYNVIEYVPLCYKLLNKR
jgi:hypothetical protein